MSDGKTTIDMKELGGSLSYRSDRGESNWHTSVPDGRGVIEKYILSLSTRGKVNSEKQSGIGITVDHIVETAETGNTQYRVSSTVELSADEARQAAETLITLSNITDDED